MGQLAPPTGTTSVAAVIGDPVAHSLSPTIHNAAFAAAGLDWVFVALPVPAGHGSGAVGAMRTLGIRGMSVTMPHKHDVVAALDHLSGAAAALGAVNCIAATDDGLVGHNTDGEGFLASLADHGVDLRGLSCVVLGAGGAARAVVHALAGAGVASVSVWARTAERAASAAILGGQLASVVSAEELPGAVHGAGLLVNATPVGMAGSEGVPLPAELLRPGLFVADLVYHPAETDLLRAAREAGAASCNGEGMLVHQAAAAFRVWTGREAPLQAMRAGLRAAVDGTEN